MGLRRRGEQHLRNNADNFEQAKRSATSEKKPRGAEAKNFEQTKRAEEQRERRKKNKRKRKEKQQTKETMKKKKKKAEEEDGEKEGKGGHLEGGDMLHSDCSLVLGAGSGEEPRFAVHQRAQQAQALLQRTHSHTVTTTLLQRTHSHQ